MPTGLRDYAAQPFSRAASARYRLPVAGEAFGKMPSGVAKAIARGGKGGDEIAPGTRLVREWNGRTIDVLATEEGMLWDGRIWRSLSAIAREVTGTAWSGPRFFGVGSYG